jgi:hypothetical protein
MGVSLLPGVQPLSKITPQTFASGMITRANGNSPALLDRLRERNAWLLTLKDFGTILSQPQQRRDPILGELREIYDGKYNASFGTGVDIDWSGKLGMIVGATPAVDSQRRWSAELGERFIQYRPKVPDPKKVAKKAREVAGQEEALQEAIGQAYVTALEAAVEFSGKNEGRLITNEDLPDALALFVAEARRPVIHPTHYKYQVLPPEGPGRLVKVFAVVYQAAVICYAGDDAAAAALVCELALSSVPGRRGRLLRQLALSEDGVTAADMAGLLECDKETARRELRDLVAIRLAVSDSPVKTEIFKRSDPLLAYASSIFPDEDPAAAIRKLFDR